MSSEPTLSSSVSDQRVEMTAIGSWTAGHAETLQRLVAETAGNFNLGRYARGQTRGLAFTRPGTVKVYCDIHSHMSATIVVFDHPYFAIPQDDGTFHNGFEGIALAVFGLHLFGLGYLVFTSASFPRFLGALVVIAGIAVALASITHGSQVFDE